MYGSRRLQQMLKREGVLAGRRRIGRLMKKLGLWAIGPKPDTSKPHPEHTVYPYLLRGLNIERPNHVWATDITYIRMRHGFLYLCAILDWATRKVLAWRLSNTHAEGAVLLSDGYGAYTQYANKTGLTHAQCWAHTRRKLFEAQDAEPQAACGLDLIGGLYAVEERIRTQKLTAARKLDYRLMHAKPIVEQFFAWINQQFEAQGLLPTNPLTKALAYARERRFGLEVYLTDPDVPIDTNHLERALRAIPMGRKNWMFCWTEPGAKYVGIMQSLIVTCRLHQIDPYDYLVDVLQRVGQHPARRIDELTPRLWKQLFADTPLRSPLHDLGSLTRTP